LLLLPAIFAFAQGNNDRDENYRLIRDGIPPSDFVTQAHDHYLFSGAAYPLIQYARDAHVETRECEDFFSLVAGLLDEIDKGWRTYLYDSNETRKLLWRGRLQVSSALFGVLATFAENGKEGGVGILNPSAGRQCDEDNRDMWLARLRDVRLALDNLQLSAFGFSVLDQSHTERLQHYSDRQRDTQGRKMAYVIGGQIVGSILLWRYGVSRWAGARFGIGLNRYTAVVFTALAAELAIWRILDRNLFFDELRPYPRVDTPSQWYNFVAQAHAFIDTPLDSSSLYLQFLWEYHAAVQQQALTFLKREQNTWEESRR